MEKDPREFKGSTSGITEHRIAKLHDMMGDIVQGTTEDACNEVDDLSSHGEVLWGHARSVEQSSGTIHLKLSPQPCERG